VNGGRAEEPGGDFGGAGAQGEPSEEELRAAYEAELSRLTSADVMLNAAASLVNVAGRRLGAAPQPPGASAQGVESPGPGEGRDLEQVRDAIDGVRALLGVLERRMGQELAPFREALSQLQLAYAHEARDAAVSATGAGESAGAASGPAAAHESAPAAPSPGPDGAEEKEESRRPGPAESSGRLWVPDR
jgi:hypothetical protein